MTDFDRLIKAAQAADAAQATARTTAGARSWLQRHRATLLAATTVVALAGCLVQTLRLQAEQRFSAAAQRVLALQEAVSDEMQCAARDLALAVRAQQGRLMALGEPELPLPPVAAAPKSGCGLGGDAVARGRGARPTL